MMFLFAISTTGEPSAFEDYTLPIFYETVHNDYNQDDNDSSCSDEDGNIAPNRKTAVFFWGDSKKFFELYCILVLKVDFIIPNADRRKNKFIILRIVREQTHEQLLVLKEFTDVVNSIFTLIHCNKDTSSF